MWLSNGTNIYDLDKEKKERKSIYIAPLILCIPVVLKRSDMDHTVVPANYTMPAFPS